MYIYIYIYICINKYMNTYYVCICICIYIYNPSIPDSSIVTMFVMTDRNVIFIVVLVAINNTYIPESVLAHSACVCKGMT